MTRMMTIPKTEYKVRLVRKDHQWEVLHVHMYANWAVTHRIYVGTSWNLCMWIATGDLSYFPDKPYIQCCDKFCGSRNGIYLDRVRVKPVIESH